MNRIMGSRRSGSGGCACRRPSHYRPEQIPYIKMAEELGVGSADLSRLQIRLIGEKSTVEDGNACRNHGKW
ncbi:MAG: hypothetical protein V8S22_04800 [Lachnospiraceae bacterium]